MKCEIVRDLLVLYTEELCSEETKNEVLDHIKSCPKCAKQLENYEKKLESDMEEVTSDESEVILQPMKKVKRKLIIGKTKVIILSTILIVILSVLGWLFYGQMTNKWMSFTAISDMIKVKYACQELVDGNTEPFMDILAHRVDDRYVITSSKQFEDVEDYRNCMEEKLKEAADYYFSGRNIKVKITEVYQYPYEEMEAADEDIMDIGIGFYEGKKLVYELYFVKVSPEKFMVYEMPENREPGFTTMMLPFYDLNLDICLNYATKTAYNRLVEKESDNMGGGLSIVITIDGTDEEKNTYQEVLMERLQKLADEGWYYKDIMYFVDEYDVEEEKWVYKVWFMLEDQSNGNIVMIEQKFHYYRQQLYVIDDSPAVFIGTQEELSEEVKERVLGIFD